MANYVCMYVCMYLSRQIFCQLANANIFFCRKEYLVKRFATFSFHVLLIRLLNDKIITCCSFDSLLLKSGIYTVIFKNKIKFSTVTVNYEITRKLRFLLGCQTTSNLVVGSQRVKRNTNWRVLHEHFNS